ncbi:HEPN domain-containing protein [Mucilaginibacter sp. OAE612]|uniref:hypothetical protein n=1 Tax=Mucilaginibacter sp. OAE612 TaxID=3156444 RepID=UPI00359EE0CE
MYFRHYVPWEHYPKNLYFEEIQNPYAAFSEFFFFADHPCFEKTQLTKLKESALSDDYYIGERGPGELVYSVRQWFRLIEACHVLWTTRKIDCVDEGPDIITFEELQEAKQQWAYFPNDLYEKELLNPFFALTKVYEEIGVELYRDHLQQWLYAALQDYELNNESIILKMESIYNNLCKLHSAAWLLNQIESGYPYESKKYKSRDNDTVSTEDHPPPAEDIRLKQQNLVNLESIRMSESASPRRDDYTKLAGGILDLEQSLSAIIYLGEVKSPNFTFLLILTDNEDAVWKRKLADSITKETEVYPIIYSVRSAVEGIKSDGRFWNYVFTEGVNIYSKDGFILPPFQIQSAEKQKEAMRAIWTKWNKIGRAFLTDAERIAKDYDCGIATFFLSQVSGYALKCVLQLAIGFRQPVNDLEKLLTLTRMLSDDFANIFELDTTIGKKNFQRLCDRYTKIANYESSLNIFVVNNIIDTVRRLTVQVEKFYKKELKRIELTE